jgi:DNA processing protein
MLVHWIWLATRPEIGDRLRSQLLETFSDAEDIYFGSEESYAQIAGMTPKAVASLMDKELSAAEKILQKCADKQINVCTWADEAYPKRLRNIPDPPVVLYYKGNLPDMEDIPVVSVVGTRKSSMYGNNMAQRFGYQIVKCGALLVSGPVAFCAAAVKANASPPTCSTRSPTV